MGRTGYGAGSGAGGARAVLGQRATVLLPPTNFEQAVLQGSLSSPCLDLEKWRYFV